MVPSISNSCIILICGVQLAANLRWHGIPAPSQVQRMSDPYRYFVIVEVNSKSIKPKLPKCQDCDTERYLRNEVEFVIQLNARKKLQVETEMTLAKLREADVGTYSVRT
jgi:hypothetical protein